MQMLDEINAAMERARRDLGVSCLSVMQHDGHASAFLHPNDNAIRCGIGHGKTVSEAIEAAYAELQTLQQEAADNG